MEFHYIVQIGALLQLLMIAFLCRTARGARYMLKRSRWDLKAAMPHYFFDIADGEDLPDLHGSELPDLTAARMEAVRYSAEVLKEMPERFWNCEAWKMTVSDADRVILFTLKFLAESAAPATVLSPVGMTGLNGPETGRN